MAYAYIQDIPDSDWGTYERIVAELGDVRPDGLVVHVAGPHDGGVRMIDVWESEGAFRAFAADHLRPARDRVLGELPDSPQGTFATLDVRHEMRGR